MKSLFIILLLSLPYLCRSQELTSPLSFSTLQSFIIENKINSVDELIEHLPSDYKKNIVAMTTSGSTNSAEGGQEGTMLAPRIISFDKDARLILSFNGNPLARGYGKIEIIENDPKTNINSMKEIVFHPKTDNKEFTPPNFHSGEKTAACLTCHDKGYEYGDAKVVGPPRPKHIWENFPSWPGAIGDIDHGFHIYCRNENYKPGLLLETVESMKNNPITKHLYLKYFEKPVHVRDLPLLREKYFKGTSKENAEMTDTLIQEIKLMLVDESIYDHFVGNNMLLNRATGKINHKEVAETLKAKSPLLQSSLLYIAACNPNDFPGNSDKSLPEIKKMSNEFMLDLFPVGNKPDIIEDYDYLDRHLLWEDQNLDPSKIKTNKANGSMYVAYEGDLEDVKARQLFPDSYGNLVTTLLKNYGYTSPEITKMFTSFRSGNNRSNYSLNMTSGEPLIPHLTKEIVKGLTTVNLEDYSREGIDIDTFVDLRKFKSMSMFEPKMEVFCEKMKAMAQRDLNKINPPNPGTCEKESSYITKENLGAVVGLAFTIFAIASYLF